MRACRADPLPVVERGSARSVTSIMLALLWSYGIDRQSISDASRRWVVLLLLPPGSPLADLRRDRLLVLPLEDLRHRLVLEDRPDGRGDDRGDGHDLDLVGQRRGKRHRVGDDDLREGRPGDPLDGIAGEHRMRGRGEDLAGALP